MNIINNRLPWNGSHLGSYMNIIISKWKLEKFQYCGIILPHGWCNEIPGGTIYCVATGAKDAFPCIVEDIKVIFGIPRRGLHRIKINTKEYIIYYVPITTRGEVVWETPLSRLDSKHALRYDKTFRRKVQKIIAFCDILALSNTTESSIRIRPGVNNEYVPINVNESATLILKSEMYDHSILTKTIFTKWFGEETSISDIVKEMACYQKSTYNMGLETDNLAIVSACIRNRVDEVIKRYDSTYTWYGCFIVDRMSRHLLIDT